MKLSKLLKSVIRAYRNTDLFDIDYESAKNIIKYGNNVILIDVRSEQEFNEGHIEGSVNVPVYELKKDCEKYLKDKQTTIILYCQSGMRSRKALKILQDKGYKNLYEIKGGLDEI